MANRLDQRRQTPHALRQLLGVESDELLSTAEIARDYKFPSRLAVRHFLYRHPGIPVRKIGRKVLVSRRAFEQFASERRVA